MQKKNKMNKIEKLFSALWDDYTNQNPETKEVFELFESQGESVINDHIAFRTFDNSMITIDVLAQFFIDLGYKFKSSYYFEQKKLVAKHFEHPTDKMAPKVFISELQVNKFSEFLQEAVAAFVQEMPTEILNSSDFLFSGRSWNLPNYQTYIRLQEESEYAAWVYVFGFRANHFTVSINSLEKHQDIFELNQFLRDHGFTLNESGGEVKGSAKELLEQSSTRAGKIDIEFEEGIYQIPSCFYEFAKRYPDNTGWLFGGFIAKSADKIFESTDNAN